MRQLQFWILISISVLQVTCKANQDFVKRKKQKTISLSNVADPKVLFVLQERDTIKFSAKDFSNLIEKQIKGEIKALGYLSSKELLPLSQSLKTLNGDTALYQHLYAVNNETLSGLLDLWIARELLLKGKAEVVLKGNKKVTKLKYIYIRDKFGGQQGTFYSSDNRVIYTSIISLGE